MRTCIRAVTSHHRILQVGLLAVSFLLPGCGDSTPTGPTPMPPVVTAVSPTSGATAGGTDVTIAGANFAANAVVTIGGVPATNVTVTSSTSLTAVTGAHAAGDADVVVTVGGLSGSLAAGFRYVTPPPNTPPVIAAVTVQGTRPNEPASFADLDEEVVVTATVQDQETPLDRLTYSWSATIGVVSGTGSSVRWRAPASLPRTPSVAVITLTVTETIATADPSAARSLLIQSVTATAPVSIHHSAKEVGDMAVQFLVDFSDSNLSPEYVIRDFWSGCPGRASELEDVQNNRANYLIQSWRVDPPRFVGVSFKGTCVFRARKGDACVQVPVWWLAMYKPTGTVGTARGIDHVSGVYRESRWWLCDSDFEGEATLLPGVFLK